MPTPIPVAAVVEGVSHTFANGVAALDKVSVTIEPGVITGFIGRNGSGKTTLLRLLAGLLPVQAGRVQIFGKSEHPLPLRSRARLSYLSQLAELDPELSTLETLTFFAALYGVREKAARIRQLASAFALMDHLPRMVGSLSGGLRQRLHLALGLLHDPELLLLDEPTASLDPEGRALVWDLLSQRRSMGTAIAVITHDLAEAAAFCQTIVLLQRGRILISGSPADIIAKHPPDLRAAYLQITGEEIEPPEIAARGPRIRRALDD